MHSKLSLTLNQPFPRQIHQGLPTPWVSIPRHFVLVACGQTASHLSRAHASRSSWRCGCVQGIHHSSDVALSQPFFQRHFYPSFRTKPFHHESCPDIVSPHSVFVWVGFPVQQTTLPTFLKGRERGGPRQVFGHAKLHIPDG